MASAIAERQILPVHTNKILLPIIKSSFLNLKMPQEHQSEGYFNIFSKKIILKKSAQKIEKIRKEKNYLYITKIAFIYWLLWRLATPFLLR